MSENDGDFVNSQVGIMTGNRYAPLLNEFDEDTSVHSDNRGSSDSDSVEEDDDPVCCICGFASSADSTKPMRVSWKILCALLLRRIAEGPEGTIASFARLEHIHPDEDISDDQLQNLGLTLME